MKSILKSFALALLAPLAAFASRYMHSAGLVRSMFQGVPTAADFRAYRVTNPNFAEVVRQPLYDYNLMPGAGSQSLAFFQTPVGAGVATALGATVGSVKSYSDTNMELGGQLPSGFEFLCDAIRLEFYPGSVSTASTYTPAVVANWATIAATTMSGAVNDANIFWQSGRLEFNVLGKNYTRATPLIKFPPACKFDLDGYAASNSATTAALYSAVLVPQGDPYDLLPPVSLQSSVNFNVSLIWPAAVAMPSGFNARVGVILEGNAKRAGQ
jgi:hypothetical protein